MGDNNTYSEGLDKHIWSQYEKAIKFSKLEYNCVFGYLEFKEAFIEEKMKELENQKKEQKHIRLQYEKALELSMKQYNCVFGFEEFEEAYIEEKRKKLENKQQKSEGPEVFMIFQGEDVASSSSMLVFQEKKFKKAYIEEKRKELENKQEQDPEVLMIFQGEVVASSSSMLVFQEKKFCWNVDTISFYLITLFRYLLSFCFMAYLFKI